MRYQSYSSPGSTRLYRNILDLQLQPPTPAPEGLSDVNPAINQTARAARAPCVTRINEAKQPHGSRSLAPLFAFQWARSVTKRASLHLLRPDPTRGVTVSMSAFLACHQCYCAGSSLAWGLNLRALVCGIFLSSSPGVFSGYSGFLPSFIGLMIQPIK